VTYIHILRDKHRSVFALAWYAREEEEEEEEEESV
jgi:hypothetical protein